MFVGLVVLWVIDGRVKQELALHAAIAVMIAWVIAEIVKTLFPTLRPYQVNGYPPLTISLLHTNGAGGGFPSSHAAVAFALAVTVWLHNKKIGFVFVLAAIGVGIGRVLGNVHYPLDIFAGAVLGTVVAFAIDKMHVHSLLSKKKA